MKEDFYKPIDRAEIRAVDGVEREEGVRFYSSQSGSSWILQVRGPLTLRNGRGGKDFMVASGYVNLETLRELHAVIGRHLRAAEADCTCHKDCHADSQSGSWHQHEDEPCARHPDAPVVG